MNNPIDFHNGIHNLNPDTIFTDVWGVELSPTEEHTHLTTRIEALTGAIGHVAETIDIEHILDTAEGEDLANQLREAVSHNMTSNAVANHLHQRRAELATAERAEPRKLYNYAHRVNQLPIQKTVDAFTKAANALGSDAYDMNTALARDVKQLQALVETGKKLATLRRLVPGRSLPAIGRGMSNHIFMSVYAEFDEPETLTYAVVHGKKTITSQDKEQRYHNLLKEIGDNGNSNPSLTLIKLAQGEYPGVKLSPALDTDTLLQRFHWYDRVGQIKQAAHAPTQRRDEGILEPVIDTGERPVLKTIKVPGR
ncbi:hypothetical protein [Corynebacterium sp. HMSC28B08]|uniref:hypothetical protein n=1 Tax=Corynebacterium TaxID=1716 RepID=UPI0008A484B9|nr:hypothetical protein [Corynebacterium sp. HMSC28B08]OFT89251.1 hypothetical protein HMPREF3098_05835 [Corynebacterium sp. HMSC28B08]